MISIILSTYNERKNIEKLITFISRVVKQPMEIIVVDDDSPDRTWEIVEKIKRKNKKVKLLRRAHKGGLGSAILDGISLSKGDVVVWLDCDFSHPPEIIPKLIEELNGYDIAIGSRYVEEGGDEREFIRVLTSRMINLFANIFLGFDVKDYTTGFVAAKRHVLNKVKFSPEGHGEYCIEFLYLSKKSGFRIKEIPYVNALRRTGESKASPNILVFLRQGINYCLKVVDLKF
jgi:dolichol-phosphate mannosyltransferase